MGLAGCVKRGYFGRDRGEGVNDGGEHCGPLFEPLEDDQEVHVTEEGSHEDGLRHEFE